LSLRALVPLLLFFAAALLPAEGTLTVHLTPQVVETDQSVSWEQELTRLTRAGVPVVMNIDAEGLSIRVTVTPFVRGGEYLLVVQGEVRQKKASGIRGSTSLQSLLVPPGETIAYFPLGRSTDEPARQMLVLIRVEPSDE
jgi:hypothetical protein